MLCRQENKLHVIFFFLLSCLQHLTEQLDLDLSPLEYMMKCYPEIKEKEEMRKIIGRYGLTGKQQVSVVWQIPTSYCLLSYCRTDPCPTTASKKCNNKQ